MVVGGFILITRELTSLIFSGKMSISNYWKVKIYIDASVGFSHIYCRSGLNNTFLSPGYVLESPPVVGSVGSTYIPRKGGGWG